MASLTQWTWVWVNSRNWWWTGKPGMLQSMGSQRVGLEWVTELNWYTYGSFWIVNPATILYIRHLTYMSLHVGASQVALMVKNPPANAEDIKTQVWYLGQEDPLEKEMATQSSILAWRIPWTEEPGRLQSMGPQSQTWLKQLSMYAALHLVFMTTHYIDKEPQIRAFKLLA